MELVLLMYNVHPYFSLTNLGQKCALYMAKYGNHSIVFGLCETFLKILQRAWALHLGEEGHLFLVEF